MRIYSQLLKFTIRNTSFVAIRLKGFDVGPQSTVTSVWVRLDDGVTLASCRDTLAISAIVIKGTTYIWGGRGGREQA